MIRQAAIILLTGFFTTLSPIHKKQELLDICKKYFPENYTVLKEYDEDEINGLSKSDSIKDYIFDVSTIVHEGYHRYLGVHSSYYDAAMNYRINDTLSFKVRNFKTFPSIEINQLVPAATRKKIFRYETYINTKEKDQVTQQFGILGLLEEAVAYYHSFATEIALFNYFKDNSGWSDPSPWMSYLSNMASYRFSISEFELFISWYMQRAKTSHPTVYHDIINDAGLKKLFAFLKKENTRLSLIYDQDRQTILSKFPGRLEVKDNFVYDNVDHLGKGLYDDVVRDLAALLQKPEHKILEELGK